jgi:putative lipoprotein
MIRTAILLAVILIAGSASAGQDKWFGKDKGMHVLTSAYLVGVSYRTYNGEFKNPPDNSRVFAVSLSAGVGIGKEVWDLKHPKHSASWKDLAADAAGITLGLILFTYLK